MGSISIGKMNSWLEQIAEALPLSAYRLFIRRTGVGFLYHVVSDQALPHVRHLYPYKNRAMFERDLVYLKEHFHPISYAQLVDYQAGRKPQSRLPWALLSFDDGFRECFTVIRPLLLKHGIPGLFFINTDGIDNRQMIYRQKISLCIDRFLQADHSKRQTVLARLDSAPDTSLADPAQFIKQMKTLTYRDRERVDAICQSLDIDIAAYLQTHQPYLSADEIRAMAAEGFTFGAHSRGHPKLNLLSPAEIEDEIVSSCQIMQELSGQSQVPFAFPFSAYGLAREMLADIRARHAHIGLLFDAKGLRKDSPFIINRIMADQPLADSEHSSDLPLHLHRAYQDVFLLQARGRGISRLSALDLS